MMLTWHVLFNSSSMISIGFVSALSHSLFNAGQRVCSVSMGILWFDDEQLTAAKALSMGVVSAGACWYIVESKMAAANASNTPTTNTTTASWQWFKPIGSLGLLQMILVFGHYETEDSVDR